MIIQKEPNVVIVSMSEVEALTLIGNLSVSLSTLRLTNMCSEVSSMPASEKLSASKSSKSERSSWAPSNLRLVVTK